MEWLARCLFLLVIIFFPADFAQGKTELIENVDLMIDHTGILDAQAAAQARFEPANRTMALGYSSSTHWVRLRVQPAPDEGEVVLFIRPAMLDDVTFYAPAMAGAEGGMPPDDIGQYHVLAQDWPSAMRGVRIMPPQGGADYLIRITSTGSIWFNVAARQKSEAIIITQRAQVIQITYLTIMFGLLSWALQMLVVTREPMFGWFALMQLAWLVNNTVYLGYSATLVPEISSDMQALILRLSVFAATLLTILFHRAVIIRFQPPYLAVRLFDVQIGLTVIGFVVFWTYDAVLGLQINAVSLGAAPFAFLINAATARTEASPGLATMRAAYAALSLSMLLNAAAVLGVWHSTIIVQYGYVLHGLTTGALMFVILHLHARNLFAEARAAKAKIAAMEHQRQMHQERTQTLAKFIDMLTHEARNALSVINMSISAPKIGEQARGRVSDAIRGLNGVIDRCNQTIRLDSNDQPARIEACDLLDILHQLCANTADPDRIVVHAQNEAIIQGDRVLLGVVFNNLLDNALKYSPIGSTVRVSVETDQAGTLVLFENMKGEAGMPDPVNIFQKYYRSQHAKVQIGSGLGLYIVRGLVHLLGGVIKYEPLDCRVRFKVFFPC